MHRQLLSTVTDDCCQPLHITAESRKSAETQQLSITAPYILPPLGAQRVSEALGEAKRTSKRFGTELGSAKPLKKKVKEIFRRRRQRLRFERTAREIAFEFGDFAWLILADYQHRRKGQEAPDILPVKQEHRN